MTFWTEFTQKGYFRSEMEHHHWIVHIRISSRTKFGFWYFLFFGPNLPKKGISSQNRENERDHWIRHIRITLDTRFLFYKQLHFWVQASVAKGFPYFKPQSRLQVAQLIISIVIFFVNTRYINWLHINSVHKNP